MIRLFLFVAMFPIVIAIVWDDAPEWAILAGWGIGAGVLILMYAQGNLRLKCPNCGKRVKIGYTTCHHCGAAVGRRPLYGQKYAAEEIVKTCEHCKTAIRPDASVCPHCQRDNPAWTLHEGTWWQQVEGSWQRLNLHSDPPTWEVYQEQAPAVG